MSDGFAERLRSLYGPRKRAEFARRAGISVGALRSYEEGTAPTSDKIVAIAAASGVSYRWLLTGEGPQFEGDQLQHQVPPVAAAPAPEADLDRIEAWLDGLSSVPLPVDLLLDPAVRRDRAILDAIALDDRLPLATRNRANMLLDLGFGSSDAAERRRAAAEELGARLRVLSSRVASAATAAGYDLPPLVAMATLSMCLDADVSERALVELFEALKNSSG